MEKAVKKCDPKKTQSQLLVELMKGGELFHDLEGRTYASFARNGHTETFPIYSTGFRSWLVHSFYRDHDKPRDWRRRE